MNRYEIIAILALAMGIYGAFARITYEYANPEMTRTQVTMSIADYITLEHLRE